MNKDRPILFSRDMVRAILSDHKTQTRRTSGLDVINNEFEFKGFEGSRAIFEFRLGSQHLIRSPYGCIGDRLWVRETWLRDGDIYLYKADFGRGVLSDSWDGHWKPSIHMPRTASRITLEITNIAVEKIQDITKEAAIAEGITNPAWTNPPANPDHYRRVLLNPYVANFSVLWDRINADRGYGWDINPWVWAITFKKVKHEQSSNDQR